MKTWIKNNIINNAFLKEIFKILAYLLLIIVVTLGNILVWDWIAGIFSIEAPTNISLIADYIHSLLGI